MHHAYMLNMFSIQIPPCRATPLHVSMLDNFCNDNLSSPGSPEDVGCRIFQQFCLFKLDLQYRSQDPVHSQNLESLRTTIPTLFPINQQLLSQYKYFQKQDVLDNPQWIFAPVVVLYNALRHSLNLEALKNYAKLSGYPILCWRNPLHGAAAAALNGAESNSLYASHPALSGFFCPGAPAYGKSNINTGKGLFNGAAMRLHSITVHADENKAVLDENIQSAEPGQVIVLLHVPISVQVEILDADPTTYTSADTLVPGKYVVPLFLDKKSQHEPGSNLIFPDPCNTTYSLLLNEAKSFFSPVKQWELNKRVGGKIGTVKFRCFGYDLGFSLTFEKTQSKGYKLLILDLQLYPRMSLTFEKFLVGLSRYCIFSNTYCLPFHWCE